MRHNGHQMAPAHDGHLAGFRQLLDEFPAAAYICDPDGLITYFNAHAADLWGREPALNEPEERFCGSLRMYRADGSPIRHDECWMALAIQQGRHYLGREIFVERADGTRRSALAYANPIRDARGCLIGAVNVLVDVTDRQRTEQALRDADRKKDEFIATLAHELRNPLAPLQAELDAVKLSAFDPEVAARSHKVMQRQVRQLARFVDDMLDISRLSHGKFTLQKSRVRIRDIAETVRADLRGVFEEADQTLVWNVPDEEIFMRADAVRLSQIFFNLLSNASKYTPQKGRIEFRVEKAADGVRVSVRDNGLGIPRDMLGSVFDMFGQVDRTLETGYRGLGIGLSLVKQLVEMHDGHIEAHSQGPGKGSEFELWIPIPPDDRAAASAPEAAQSNVSQNVRRRVLLVEDNRDVARALGRVVRLLGHEFQVAYDGEAALEAAAQSCPDVILMDIGLPKLNGYDTARIIRERQSSPNPFLIAVTGWGQADDRQRALEAGFDAHLTKPVDLETLRELLLKPSG